MNTQHVNILLSYIRAGDIHQARKHIEGRQSVWDTLTPCQVSLINRTATNLWGIGPLL